MRDHLLSPFLVSFLVSVLLTPLAGRLAVRLGRVSAPKPSVDGHTRTTPILGGLAVFCAALPFLLSSREVGLAVCAILMALVGLADDFFALSPVRKLIGQAVVGIAAAAAGLRFELFGVSALDAVATVLWLVAVANAFNVIDMMNGLSAGVGGIASFGFAAALAWAGQAGSTAVALALCGGLCGFLVYNFHPARIFMGNVGSQFAAGALGGMAVLLQSMGGGVAGFLFLGFPLFEAFFLIVVRTRQGRKWYLASRDHTAQRLVQAGCSIRGAVLILYAAAFLCAGLALIAVRSGPFVACALAGGLAGCGWIAGWRLAKVDMGTET